MRQKETRSKHRKKAPKRRVHLTDIRDIVVINIISVECGFLISQQRVSRLGRTCEGDDGDVDFFVVRS